MELFLNKAFRLSLFLATFLLTSCGGGGSTTEEVVSPIISPPTPTNTEPICSNSGYARTLLCSMKRRNLDREFYVYIPDGIEDLSSVHCFLVFMVIPVEQFGFWDTAAFNRLQILKNL